MRWTIITDFIDDWIDGLSSKDAKHLISAFDALESRGPALGRPLVDRITGSRIHNLKELRPPSTGGSEIRVLFVFDVERHAIMLLAGDKAGNLASGPRWSRWYRKAIPETERRFEQYQLSHRKDDR